jgi:hypothetical protein
MGVPISLKGALTDLYHQSSSYLAKVLRRVLYPRRTEMELKKKKKKNIIPMVSESGKIFCQQTGVTSKRCVSYFILDS